MGAALLTVPRDGVQKLDNHAWTEAHFIKTWRTGITPTGHTINAVRPWGLTGQMADDEPGAIFANLQSLPSRPYNSSKPLGSST